jgi:hypothetical protein
VPVPAPTARHVPIGFSLVASSRAVGVLSRPAALLIQLSVSARKPSTIERYEGRKVDMSHNHIRGRFACVVLGGLMVIATAAPVGAQNFGSGLTNPCDTTKQSECVANNGNHAVWFGSPRVSVMSGPMTWAIDHVYHGRAHLTVWETTSSNADVRLLEGQYAANGFTAWTYCWSDATYGGQDPGRWCRPQGIKFNLTYSSRYNTTTKKRYIACHELGHTLGLQHSNSESNGDSTCMYAGGSVDGNTPNQLRNHDYNLLDAFYPDPIAQSTGDDPEPEQ